ncbi:MAG: hypothetical protein RI947_42 [Candidatus Parcubacteria bacterium]|jgi:hypothetical protein
MKNNRAFFYILAVIVIAAAFIRLYQINDYATFLGDQGRDSIIVKRIATLEHFPAIGAPSSLNTPSGYIYLGPFFYYFLTPFQLLSQNPAVLAGGVAVFNSASIIAAYLAVTSLVGPVAGICMALLIGFSQVNVFLSRFAWNPNILPFFSFMSLFFFIRSLRSKNRWNYILFGAFCALSLQLHFLYLAVIPTYFIVLIYLYLQKKLSLQTIKQYVLSILSFAFISTPLIIFDIRHNFQNTKAFFSVFTQTDDIGINSKGGLISGFFDTIRYLFTYILRMDIDTALLGIILFVLIVAVYAAIKRGKNMIIPLTATVTVLSLVIISLYHGDKYEHYFTPVYYIFFFLLSLIFAEVHKHFPAPVKYLTYMFMVLYVLNNIAHLDFVSKPPGMQIETARTTADVIARHITQKKYSLTTLPDKYSDSTYRYFLEIKGKRPIEKDTLEKADELFVVCEAACKPIGDPQWDIAYFAPTKIDGVWKHKGVTIYRLIH